MIPATITPPPSTDSTQARPKSRAKSKATSSTKEEAAAAQPNTSPPAESPGDGGKVQATVSDQGNVPSELEAGSDQAEPKPAGDSGGVAAEDSTKPTNPPDSPKVDKEGKSAEAPELESGSDQPAANSGGAADRDSTKPATPPDSPKVNADGETAEAPDPAVDFDERELKPIVSSLVGIDEMDIESVRVAILATCQRVNDCNGTAVRSSKLVLANGWKNGKLINRAKALLKGKGKFGEWRDKHLVGAGVVDLRTSQRYQALARKWENLDSLLNAAPNIWTAYKDAGILPKDALSENAKKSGVAPKDPAVKFLEKFANVQSWLRSLVELKLKVPEGTKVELPEADLAQFKSTLEQINKFAATLVKQAA